MARVLHIVHAQAVKDIGAVVDDLEALLETGRFPLDVTATNQEDLVTGGLDVGEVVLERHLHVYAPTEHLLACQAVLVDVFRVALKDVDRGQVAAI